MTVRENKIFVIVRLAESGALDEFSYIDTESKNRYNISHNKKGDYSYREYTNLTYRSKELRSLSADAAEHRVAELLKEIIDNHKDHATCFALHKEGYPEPNLFRGDEIKNGIALLDKYMREAEQTWKSEGLKQKAEIEKLEKQNIGASILSTIDFVQPHSKFFLSFDKDGTLTSYKKMHYRSDELHSVDEAALEEDGQYRGKITSRSGRAVIVTNEQKIAKKILKFASTRDFSFISIRSVKKDKDGEEKVTTNLFREADLTNGIQATKQLMKMDPKDRWRVFKAIVALEATKRTEHEPESEHNQPGTPSPDIVQIDVNYMKEKGIGQGLN